MIGWIKVAVGIQDDPKLQVLADALKVKLPHAVGLVVCALVKLPDHAPDGDLAGIPASSFERWAGWHGKAGLFDQQFRLILCAGTVVSAWDRLNGSAIREAARSAQKSASYRSRQRGSASNRSGNDTGDDTGDATGVVTGQIRLDEIREELSSSTGAAIKLFAMPAPTQSSRGRRDGLTRIDGLLPQREAQ